MDDAELVEAVRAGDREAFGSLVERHHAWVYALAYRMTGSRPDAGDLAHDAFVEAYLKLDQLRDAARFRPWLRQVALNLCRMWYRRLRGRERELSGAVDELESPSCEPPSPDLSRMSLGLSRLSPAHRMALVLHYIEGLSYAEIAKFLDVPIGTVMSRLHRARRALRTEIEEIRTVEEVPMGQDDDIQREVQAEVGLLLDRFGAERGAADRLTVVLRRSPEQLARLIDQADDEAVGELALLLPRLGAAAMSCVLDVYLRGAGDAAQRASGILCSVVARCRVQHRGGFGQMAAREVFVLLDGLFESSASAEMKAELLFDLLEAAEAEPVAALLTNALLCYPGRAFELLWERLRSVESPDELYASSCVVYGLCRTGARFCEALLERLDGAPEQRLVALAGAEALARCLERRDPGPSDERLAEEVRVRHKFPPLRAPDVGEAALARLGERVAELVDDARAEIRATALRTLGLLRASAHAARIRAQLDHADATTRSAAILALADLADRSADAELVAAARGGEAAVRCAALAALARLRVQEAEPLAVELIADPEPRVREAAVVALGEIGGPRAREALREVLGSDNRRLRNAAAKSLYRRRATRPGLTPTGRARMRRIRGEARPFARYSLGTCIRFALTEAGPYEERDLTRRIARVCSDYSSTRRFLIEEGVMTRTGGSYRFTELGAAIRRVELFIREHYLSG